MISKQSLLKDFKESIPAWRSSSVHSRYPRLAEHFIDYIGAKSTYNRADAMKFLNYITRSGGSSNYVRWSYYVLRQFYKSLGIEFPLSARELPPLPGPDEMNAPVFTHDYVERFITTVKKRGDAGMKAYLALSTTYGFRRCELTRFQNSNISNGLLGVKAVKGGQLREHLIPEEIVSYIDGYHFKQVSEQTLTNIFHRMQKLSALPQNLGDGYHAFRRALITELLGAGVPIPYVYSFIGWKLSSKLGIMGVYTRPDPRTRDGLIYSKHPFLPLWSSF